MRIKSHNVTEDQLVRWCLKNHDYPVPDPFKVIEEIKSGKQWTCMGIPIKLKPRK